MDDNELNELVEKQLKFKQRLRVILFGEDYLERMALDQLTDDKLLEAVRMLKEVY
jgi:hypothetical protein